MEKKFRCWVKVDGGETKSSFKTWHVNNLLKFTDFLDTKYSDWRFFNVYRNSENEEKDNVELARFTKNNRPRSAWIYN